MQLRAGGEGMKGRSRLAVAVAVVAALAVVVTTAVAGGGKEIREHLTGYQEDPLALSTPGKGTLQARIDQFRRPDLLPARLRGPRGLGHAGPHPLRWPRAERRHRGVPVLQPASSPPAPRPVRRPTGTVSGTLEAADVIGPAGQGIDPGEFGELVDAIRAGVTYANVHSTKYPGGEIRAQLDKRHPGATTTDPGQRSATRRCGRGTVEAGAVPSSLAARVGRCPATRSRRPAPRFTRSVWPRVI